MKSSVQADGGGTSGSHGDESGRSGGGDSGGGAYPNPHRGKKPQDGFLGHGGQTEMDEKPRPGESKVTPDAT